MRWLPAFLVFAFIAISAPRAEALLCTPVLGCTCSVTASDIVFDAFTPFEGAQDAVGQIEVDCTGVVDVAPAVVTQLDDGEWGSFSLRRMRNQHGDLLGYNLYTTSQHNTIWGSGGGFPSVTINGGVLTLGHWRVTRTVYARATPTVTTRPGAYSDTVVVRIVW